MTAVPDAGDRLDRLAELRDLKAILWASIRGAESSRDVAALSRQLTDVLEQIETLEKASVPVKGTPLDELRSRRARRPASGRGARSAG